MIIIIIIIIIIKILLYGYNRVRTLFQKQISRTIPGLFQDPDWFFKSSKIHINPYTPKIAMLILLTAFRTLQDNLVLWPP